MGAVVVYDFGGFLRYYDDTQPTKCKYTQNIVYVHWFGWFICLLFRISIILYNVGSVCGGSMRA